MKANNISSIIPILEKEIHFSFFDNSSYLVSQEKYNYEVNINKRTYQILQLVDGKNTLEEITAIFNTNNNQNITTKIVHQLLYNKLKKYGIVENKNVVVEPLSRASYLKLSTIIIPANVVNKAAILFTPLFKGFALKTITLITLLFSLFMGVNYYHLLEPFVNNLSEVSFLFVLPIILIGIFIHELGHAAAAKYYGVNSRGIGFGFYLFTPTFFADVTKAWQLSSKQRVVIDLAGIYFELIYISFLLIVFILTNEINFLATSFLLFISIFYTLNPFLRTDGYWVVSDGLKIPNLRKQSFEKLKLFFKKIAKRNDITFSKKDWFLVVYALSSLSFIVFFVVSILIWNSDSVLYFPVNLYHFVKEILTGKLNDWSLKNLTTIILPLVFYYLLISISYKTFKKRKNKQIDE